MSYSGRGRPRGRPTKEYSEYVPKGIDPRAEEYEPKGNSNGRPDWAADDQQRPTEDKAENRRPNRPNRGNKPRNETGWSDSNNHRNPKGKQSYQDEYVAIPKDQKARKPTDESRNTQNMDYETQPRKPAQTKPTGSGLMPYHKREKPNKLGKTSNQPNERNTQENQEGVVISKPDSELQSADQDGEKKVYQWRECVICLLKCSPTSTVWSCQGCRITCHLKCLKDWICKQNNIENYNPKTADREKVYSWTCPHCKAASKETMPTYQCFCLKQKNPKPDPFVEPHSCGQRCGRNRGGQCPHACGELCHGGACPPCKIVVPAVSCYCGAETIDRVCGELNKRSCGTPCAKKLNCGLHTCERPCHEGDCAPCQVAVPEASCHCGKTVEERKCGETFSCGKVCDRNLHCSVHKCAKICHPQNCEKCLLAPYPGETCYCGKKSQADLLGHPRSGCDEQRKTCGQTCGAMLVCGHRCSLPCHEGECRCSKDIEKKCRCGCSTFTVACNKYLEEVLCDRPCKKKKSCKVHKCEIKCCIALQNSPEHLCLEYCGRMLECGIHPCPRKCHTGKCGDCEIKVNQTLRCACGSRVIPAPIKCGTEIPKCYNKCGKILPCGHPCLYDCHYGDCKPCQEIVDKKCACGKKTIEKSLCSLTMYCQNLCKNKLPCGHECGHNCHAGSCVDITSKKKLELLQQGMNPSESGCARACGRIRSACAHPCEALCHPDSLVCPNEPCKYMIQVYCACGNKSKFLECESTDKKIKKQLQCEEECRNLQRFRALYEKSQKKLYYPGFLVKYVKNNLTYIQKLEEKLMYFLIGNEKTLTFHVDKTGQERIKLLTTLLSKHYLLEVTIHKVSKNAIITASKRMDSLIPKVTLSQYLDKLNKGDVDIDPSPFDAKIWFYNLNFFENANELDKHLEDVRDECYIEVDRAGHIKLYVWNKTSIPAITKRLLKSGSGFAQFEIEEYQEKSDDESQLKVDIKQEDDTPKEATLQASVLADEPANPFDEPNEDSPQQTEANPEPSQDSGPQAAEQPAAEDAQAAAATSDPN